MNDLRAKRNDNEFIELIHRIRTGDAKAAEELIEKYERRFGARRDYALVLLFGQCSTRWIFASRFLGSFFVRVAAGQYDLDSPARLMKLLIVMTRNKVREKARKRREQGLGSSEPMAVGEDHASRVLEQDFLIEFRQRLSDDERRLWDLRGKEASWQNIASELGASSEALRQQYSRAIHRVARELGVEESA